MAGVERIGLQSLVLETKVLPLNDTPKLSCILADFLSQNDFFLQI